jgi:hypothetical protein
LARDSLHHGAPIPEKQGKKEEAMNPSLQDAALWHRLKQIGLVVLFISALVLLALLAVAGAGMSHAHQGAVPTGGLMAPIDNPNDPPTSGLAATNGDIHVGEIAASVGDIHIGS